MNTATIDQERSAIALLEKISDLITALSRPQIPIDKALWDAEASAAYLTCNENHFRSRIAARHDFPAAIRLGDGERAPLRWPAKEVIAWAESRREKRGNRNNVWKP